MRASLRMKRALIGTAVGAMVLGLMPAGAALADGHVVDFSEVCAGAEDASFPDIGTTHADAISCMTAYGVIQGFEDGTFGTTMAISRQQFASLVARFALTAAPDLEVNTEDHPFTDVTSETHGPNIAALYNLDIIEGTTATTFEPNASLTRAQAASILARAHAALGVDLPEDAESDFTDLGETHGDNIEALAELGIILGQTDTVFGYNNPVQRGQIASFLARSAQVLLDNGLWDGEIEGALRAGLNLELSAEAAFAADADVTATATLLDDDLEPVVAEIVAFGILDDDGDEAEWSGAEFALQLDDPQTDDDGVAEWDIPFLVPGEYTVAVWTGDLETDDLADADDFATATLTIYEDADDLQVVTLAGEDGLRVPFGTADVVTVQLVEGDDEDPVAAEGISILVDVSVDVLEFSDEEIASGFVTSLTGTTDADGSATFNIPPRQDPNPDDDGDLIEHAYYAYADANGNGVFFDMDDLGPSIAYTIFTDEEGGEVATVEIETVGSTSPDDALGAAELGSTATVRVTATDVFGNPVAGEDVEFTAEGDGSDLLVKGTRVTNASGVASFTYSGPDDRDAVLVTADVDGMDYEVVHAWYDAADDDDANDVVTMASDIWARSASSVVLLGDGGPAEFTWEAGNDQFNEGGDAVTAAKFAGLVADAEAGDMITVTSYDIGGVSVWTFNP